MDLLSELYARFLIAKSNFTARWSWLILPVFLGFVALCFLVGVARTLLAGWRLRRSTPLREEEPDPALKAHAAESLQQAIRIPTVTGDREAMQQLDQWLRQRYPAVFRELTSLSAPAGSVVLRWRGPKDAEGEPILFCGHLDVVPAGDGWQEDPFSGRMDEDEVIHGRGAIDCKNVVIGLLEAIDSLLSEGWKPQRDVYFAFGHDEETGGAEGAARIAEDFARRGIHFGTVLDEGGYITRSHYGRANFPAALIGVGEKGCCYYRLTAEGKAGHSSMPPRHSSVGYLAEAVCRIEAAPPKARLLEVTETNVRLSAPAMRFKHRFAVCNLPFSTRMLFRMFGSVPDVNPMFRTTLACTQVTGAAAPNILSAQATATVNARVLQGDTPEGIRRYIESLVGDLPVKVEPILEIPASELASTESESYARLCGALTDKYPGLPCIPGIQSITTDSRHYQSVCGSIFKFMPFVLDGTLYDRMHNSDERIPAASLAHAVELYKKLIREL